MDRCGVLSRRCSFAAHGACGFIKRPHALDGISRVDALQLRLGHFAEVAEAANDRLEIRDLHAERAGALAEDFVEFGRR